MSGGFVEGDPSGSAGSTPAAESTGSVVTAPASSGPTDANTSAVESQQAAETTDATPTPDSLSAEDQGDNEGSDAESEDERPRNDEERKLSRRERQRLREQERIDKAIADALAAKDREREHAEESRKQQETRQAAEKARQERLSQYVGTPDTLRTMQTEIDQLNHQIRQELLQPTPGVDLDALISQAAEKTAKRDRLTENQTFRGELEADIWNGLEADFSFAATFPELANDAAARAAYLHNQGGIRGALTTLAETIRTATAREWEAKLSEQNKKHASELKAVEADRDGWRVRAGGGELAPAEAGVPATDGTWTRERLARMSVEEYRKHRVSIERAAAAGLIR